MLDELCRADAHRVGNSGPIRRTDTQPFSTGELYLSVLLVRAHGPKNDP